MDEDEVFRKKLIGPKYRTWKHHRHSPVWHLAVLKSKIWHWRRNGHQWL